MFELFNLFIDCYYRGWLEVCEEIISRRNQQVFSGVKHVCSTVFYNCVGLSVTFFQD